MGRLCIACRAVDTVLPEPHDDWMASSQFDLDFAEFVGWKRVESRSPDVPYDASREGLVERPGGLGIDVAETIRTTSALAITEEQTGLPLDARY